MLLHTSYLPLGVPNGLVIHHAQGQFAPTSTWSSSYFSGAVAGDLVATTIKACFIRIPTKRIRTGLGGGNLQGSLSQRTLGYRSKRSEQNLVATTIKF